MQEDTQVQVDSSQVMILETVRPWENVRLRGEDIRMGATVGRVGERISATRLALLAASGAGSVEVGRRPDVGLVATGTELREPGQTLQRGQIYESNRLALAQLVRQTGAIPKLFRSVKDDFQATRQVLDEALQQCDLVVTCGGVSVGEMDFVKDAFQACGGEVALWRVAVKPGRPFAFGRRDKKLLFGLPGNPVSAFVTFLLLVRPALLRWQGAADILPITRPGCLAEPLVNHGPRRHFMRVRVDAKGEVRSAGAQASHMLSSLAIADGLVDVPANGTLPAGAQVKVVHWE
jgi:molybdopterin molybdotransferase